MELILSSDVENGVSMTLKEITDVIGMRHNDAKKIVEELALEDGFGLLRKIRISHIKGKTIETYLFDSRQAIIVTARLDNKSLIKIVDTLGALYNQNKQLHIENEKHQTEILELKLKEKDVVMLNLLAQHAKELAEAKKLNTYHKNGLDYMSMRKYKIESGTKYKEDFLWEAMVFNNKAITEIQLTSYRRIAKGVPETEAITIKSQKTQVFTVKVIEESIKAYEDFLMSLNKKD